MDFLYFLLALIFWPVFILYYAITFFPVPTFVLLVVCALYNIVHQPTQYPYK